MGKLTDTEIVNILSDLVRIANTGPCSPISATRFARVSDNLII